jgi:hypothetical protein
LGIPAVTRARWSVPDIGRHTDSGHDTLGKVGATAAVS